MTEKQISKLAGALVEHQSHFNALPKDDAQWVIKNTPEAIALCVQAIKNRELQEVSTSEKVLKRISSVTIPATTGKFIAKDKFEVNINSNAPVKISYLDDNFKQGFLAGEGKVEEAKAETSLVYAKLLKGSVDAPIIAELGGEDKAETTLAEIFALMSQQSNGQEGVLRNTGYANIFYVRDQVGVLRAVRVRWGDDGWRVFANSLEDTREWDASGQVFSRNS